MLTVGHVSVRRAADPVAARRMVAAALAAAERDWLPPAAILIVRRLGDPLPGAMRLARPGPAPAWSAAASDAIAELAAGAARAAGPVPAGATAVMFASEAELLACLARDWCDGSLMQHWWWRGVVTCPDQPRAVAAAWLERASHAPAALATLRRDALDRRFADRLPAAAAAALTTAICRAHGCEPVAADGDAASALLATAARATAGRSRVVAASAPEVTGDTPFGPEHAGGVQDVSDDTPPIVPGRHAAAPGARPASRKPRGHDDRAPRPPAIPAPPVKDGRAAHPPAGEDSEARPPAGDQRAPRPPADDNRAPGPAADDHRAPRPPAGVDPAARPPAGDHRAPRPPADEDGAPRPRGRRSRGARARHAGETSGPTTAGGARVASTARPAVAADAPAHELPVWPASPTPHITSSHMRRAAGHVPAAGRDVAEADPVRRPDARSEGRPLAPERRERIAATASTAQDPITAHELTAAGAHPPAPPPLVRRIPTERAGTFFVVNLLLLLGLYGDFSDAQRRLELELWDAVALMAAALDDGLRDDPVWALLAELAGRAPEDGPDWMAVPRPAGWRAPSGWNARPGREPGWLDRLAVHVRTRVERALDAPATVLVRVPGDVLLTDARIDVEMPLVRLPVTVRLAGLDRDPGWLPAGGLDLRFHFR